VTGTMLAIRRCLRSLNTGLVNHPSGHTQRDPHLLRSSTSERHRVETQSSITLAMRVFPVHPHLLPLRSPGIDPRPVRRFPPTLSRMRSMLAGRQ
jgi:hypothetical protein